jgi:hypothetical protein
LAPEFDFDFLIFELIIGCSLLSRHNSLLLSLELVISSLGFPVPRDEEEEGEGDCGGWLWLRVAINTAAFALHAFSSAVALLSWPLPSAFWVLGCGLLLFSLSSYCDSFINTQTTNQQLNTFPPQ